MTNLSSATKAFPRTFWLIWFIEFWERFAYYGVSAILTLFFVKKLGYQEAESIYTFGSFFAFVYGFTWIGGLIGDKYLGAKRTLILGACILIASYTGLALSTPSTVFYAMAGIVIGNGLFKANPSSLVSKLYHEGAALDGAMTLYYVAVNLGSLFSMSITPIIAENYGWPAAFWLCAAGLLTGLFNFMFFQHWLNSIQTKAGAEPIRLRVLALIIFCSIIGILVVAQLLPHTEICRIIVDIITVVGFFHFLRQAFRLPKGERNRMLVAFMLLLQGIVFFVLYSQMQTSLIFFAEHHVQNYVLGLHISPAEYQVLNPIVIILMSIVLTKVYRKFPATHATKFCVGMSLCAIAFLALSLAKFDVIAGKVPAYWMVICYFFLSTGELLISALGLAMVAELCPTTMSGFVMGIWLLTTMIAGPLGAWVAAMTAPQPGLVMSSAQSLAVYSQVFAHLGLIVLGVSIIMWCLRKWLNRLVLQKV